MTSKVINKSLNKIFDSNLRSVLTEKKNYFSEIVCIEKVNEIFCTSSPTLDIWKWNKVKSLMWRQ